jgi:hypothetical protein
LNESRAYSLPRPMGKFWAMVRLPRDGKAKPVTEWCSLEKKEKPKRFDDRYSALRAATDELERYMNSPMRRDGETLSACRSEANKLFEKVG